MSEPRFDLNHFYSRPVTVHDNGRPPDTWQPIYLSGVQDDSAVQPTLGHGLVYPGLRHVFSGPQESAKTLAAYMLALDVIRAHPAHLVLLIDFEMGPRGSKRRWRDCGATDDELDTQILYISPDTPALLERIEILVSINPTLVIVDAAAGAFDNEGLDDNKRQDAERWRKLYVDPFFDNGIATIVLDHVVKNTETRGKYSIGSERKTGGGEVHIGFDTIKPIKRGSTGLYKMILHKDREGHHNRGHFYDLHIESNPETHQITCEFRPVDTIPEGQIWMPTHLMQKISQALQEATEPLSRNQIELTVPGKTDHKRAALDHLVRLNYTTETTGPRHSRLYQNTRSFTVYEWENPPSSDLAPTSPPPRPGEDTSHLAPPPLKGVGHGARSKANSNTPPRPQLEPIPGLRPRTNP